GLFGLEFGAHVFAHVHVGDVDRENFEGGIAVEGLAEHGLGDAVGILQHVLVGLGGADGRHDAFTDARDDGFLGGAADKAVEVGAHGHAGLDLDGDAILGDGVDGVFARGGVWAIDDLGIDRGFYGFEDGFSGAFGSEVNGAGAVVIEAYAGLFGSDEGQDDHFNVTARQVMRGKVVDRDFQSRLHRGNAGVHHQANRNAAQAKRDQFGVGDPRAGKKRADPNAKEIDEDDEDDQQQHSQDAPGDQLERRREL